MTGGTIVGGTMSLEQWLKRTSTREKLEFAKNLPTTPYGDYGKSQIVNEALLEIMDRLEVLEAKAPDLEDLE